MSRQPKEPTKVEALAAMAERYAAQQNVLLQRLERQKAIIDRLQAGVSVGTIISELLGEIDRLNGYIGASGTVEVALEVRDKVPPDPREQEFGTVYDADGNETASSDLPPDSFRPQIKLSPLSY